MKFDELDAKMRIFETAHDHCVLPGIFIVARLDGRSFTKLTKETLDLAKPFDINFNNIMLLTVQHLMENSGARIIYGYTESDEISLLFHPEDALFGHKLRKLNSILAGEASAFFTQRCNTLAVFDCRISQLSTIQNVVDYFRWRQEDAARNALNSYCYWKLRQTKGISATQATKALEHSSVAEKNELLFQLGVNFNDIPAWEKRGVGLYWKSIEKDGYNPKTKVTTKTLRHTIVIDSQLPLGDEYATYISTKLDHQNEHVTVTETKKKPTPTKIRQRPSKRTTTVGGLFTVKIPY